MLMTWISLIPWKGYVAIAKKYKKRRKMMISGVFQAPEQINDTLVNLKPFVPIRLL